MIVEKKQQEEQMNCFQKLEFLSAKLKDLSKIMTEMKEGMQQRKAASK